MRKIYLLTIFLLAIAPAVMAQRAKSVILVYLDGGPAQTDTFDPKPEAGRNYYGSYKGVCKTNVEGIEIGEKLPLLATMADKYTLIRSLTHGSNAHETGHYLGLFHSSERARPCEPGETPGEDDCGPFGAGDTLADTAYGDRDNLMYYRIVDGGANHALSAGQAFVLRRNPLVVR